MAREEIDAITEGWRFNEEFFNRIKLKLKNETIDDVESLYDIHMNLDSFDILNIKKIEFTIYFDNKPFYSGKTSAPSGSNSGELEMIEDILHIRFKDIFVFK